MVFLRPGLSASRALALFAAAIAFSLSLSAASAHADARSDCPGVDAAYNGSNLAAMRTAVICLTNRERVARGMAALNDESHLTDAAQGHSEDMATNNYFDHTDRSGGQPWDRTKAAGYTSGWVGENIAAGYATPYAVVLGWMKSSGHCKNILNSPYVDIGIGVAKSSSSRYGTYWTMVLGGHSSAGAVLASCPYSELVTETVQVPVPPSAAPATKAKVTSLKRRGGGKYRVKGRVTPAAKGLRVRLTVKRGKKSKKYTVKTTASGAFTKTVKAPRGSGKVRVTAKLAA